MIDLIPFKFEESFVRVLEKEGEPWWVASDVCDVLTVEAKHSISSLDDDEKSKVDRTDLGLNPGQPMWVVNEPGLYSLILKSRKPEAKAFKRWVTHEVIPSIRKYGKYAPQIPGNFLEALQLAADLQKKIELHESLMAAARPKIDFFDAVASSKDAIEMKHVAKTLGSIGRNRLFQFLRDQNVLMRDNTPYQEYVDRGYFRLVEQKYTTPDGETHIRFKTLVYQRGVNWIRTQLEKRGVIATGSGSRR